jgi:hypothetical protein
MGQSSMFQMQIKKIKSIITRAIDKNRPDMLAWLAKASNT